MHDLAIIWNQSLLFFRGEIVSQPNGCLTSCEYQILHELLKTKEIIVAHASKTI